MNRTSAGIASSVPEMHTVDALYVKFLKCFYDDGDIAGATKIAARLRDALTASPELAESIRGEEIRALIAELDGDYQAAIRGREAELRKILELHTLTVNTPSWEYVARQYDFSDVSDRLDLLAILYDRHGDAERAAATLRESRQYCESHQIPFDGQELLDDLERRRAGPGPRANGTIRKRKTSTGKRLA